MESIVANIAGKIRRERLKGRAFTVAPVTMIVEGVLNGSQGAIFYPGDEIAKTVAAWNSLPLLLNHPAEGSGRDPAVIEKQGLGHIFNAAIKDGKLSAELWFDESRAEEFNRSIMFNLRAGRKMEISTGLGLDQEPADEGSVFNGTPYKATARNFRPDHLALLLDTAGACSVKDGCGVLNRNQKDNIMAELTEKQKTELIESITENSCCWEKGDEPILNALSDEKLTLLKGEADSKQLAEAVHNAAVKGFTDPGGNDHTWNEEKKEWEAKMKKPDPKDEKTVNNAAPALTPEQVESLAFADTVRQERRDEAIATITANESNKVTAEQLAAMPLDVIQNMAASVPVKETPPAQSYAGAAGVSAATQNAAAETAPLEIPVVDYAE